MDSVAAIVGVLHRGIGLAAVRGIFRLSFDPVELLVRGCDYDGQGISA
jgi:hypothetical protein